MTDTNPTYRQARSFTLDNGTQYIENPDGSWTNLTSETVWPIEYMRVHFPFLSDTNYAECTCDERPNYYGSRCLSCIADIRRRGGLAN